MAANNYQFTGSVAPILVTVTPHRAAFFAGEPITLDVRVENTRRSTSETPQSPRTPPAFKYTHKRASHSVSSAPLSRPPTSPGTPKLPGVAATTSIRTDSFHQTGRRGVIGVRPKQRSLSADIRTFQTPAETPSNPVASPVPTIPRITTINPRHPHARKQSIDASAFSPVIGTPSSAGPSFSSSLESISESAASSGGQEFTLANGSRSTSEISYSGPHPRRGTFPGLGQPPRNRGAASYERKSISAAYPTPGSELLIYGYAQLQVTLTFDQSVDASKSHVRLQKSRVFGGGTMDLASRATSSSSPARSNKGFSSSLWPSFLKANNETPGAAETELPVYSVQPTPLFVDLNLDPGAVKMYSYSVDTPDNLPPTFKGRFFRIDYQVTLGVSRRKSPLDAKQAHGYTSQTMKIPLRVYNHVRGSVIPYDILWPLSLPLDQNLTGFVTEKPLNEKQPFKQYNISAAMMQTGLTHLRQYASKLRKLQQVRSDDHQLDSAHEEMSGDDSVKGCKEAVEICTRVSRKVSYLVARDSVHIATLEFVKTAYRLGESVFGLIDINQVGATKGTVLKAMAVLESIETLPCSLTLIGNYDTIEPHTVIKLHAEQAASFTSHTTRLSFSLDIPSDASPTFNLYDSSSPNPPVGLQWRVRLILLVAIPISQDQRASRSKPQQRRLLVRDRVQREWGFSYTASDKLAPLERLRLDRADVRSPTVEAGWKSYFKPAFLSKPDEICTPPRSPESSRHELSDDSEVSVERFQWKGKSKDGVLEPDGLGEEDEWRKMALETVECEVPITVYPGNTPFRPTQITFEI